MSGAELRGRSAPVVGVVGQLHQLGRRHHREKPKKQEEPEEEEPILPLPPPLSSTYILKWANPTRIGAGAGVAYSLDVITGAGEIAPARTRHLYITYMDEAGPSRCRVALAKAIQQLGPILYTAEADARDVSSLCITFFISGPRSGRVLFRQIVC